MKPRVGSIALLAALVINACNAEQPAPVTANFFYDSWRVTKINTTGEITESESRMTSLIGAVVMISARTVQEGSQPPCQVLKPYPILSVVKTNDEVTPKSAPTTAAAGLPEEAPMLDTGCMAFFKVGTHLVFTDRGAWYTAERVKP
jgi:hypothetical protein